MKSIDEKLKSILRGHIVVESRGVKAVKAAGLCREEGIEHGFTARVGGVSPAPYNSLNFSFTRPDAPENVSRNYSIFASAFDLDRRSFVAVNHEHGANVIRVDRGDCGRGIDREPLPFCDGIITNDPAVTLITLHADCGCVYLYDREHNAIALAHSGWKGTYLRIAQRMVEKMQAEFNTDPLKIVAAIGPNIGFDRFEVDEAIGADFEREFGYAPVRKQGKKNKAYVDIKTAIAIALMDAGVNEENISMMDLCTYDREDLFFSHRRDKGANGAMIGFLKLK